LKLSGEEYDLVVLEPNGPGWPFHEGAGSPCSSRAGELANLVDGRKSIMPEWTKSSNASPS
jgi:hypothetical protein